MSDFPAVTIPCYIATILKQFFLQGMKTQLHVHLTTQCTYYFKMRARERHPRNIYVHDAICSNNTMVVCFKFHMRRWRSLIKHGYKIKQGVRVRLGTTKNMHQGIQQNFWIPWYIPRDTANGIVYVVINLLTLALQYRFLNLRYTSVFKGGNACFIF